MTFISSFLFAGPYFPSDPFPIYGAYYWAKNWAGHIRIQQRQIITMCKLCRSWVQFLVERKLEQLALYNVCCQDN